MIFPSQPDPQYGSTELARQLQRPLESLFAELHEPADARNRYEVPSPEADSFRRDFYVQDRTHDTIDIPSEGLTLSYDEARIYAYCTSPREYCRRCVVLKGHAGTGKSTLLRTFLFAIYPSSETLKRQFLPVYITAFSHKDVFGSTADALYEFILGRVHALAWPVIHDTLTAPAQRSHFIDWLLRNSPDGRIRQAATDRVDADPTWDVIHAALTERDAVRREATRYYSNYVKPICVFLDDVDGFDESVYDKVFGVVDRLYDEGFRSVVTVRTSTFQKFNNRMHQYLEDAYEVLPNTEKIREVFARRLNKTKAQLLLESPSGVKVRTTVARFGQSLCDLLAEDACEEFIVGTSNANLKAMFGKVRWIVNSRYLDPGLMAAAELESAMGLRRTAKKRMVWRVYSAVLANRYLSYAPDDENLKLGLVNLYTSGDGLRAPWRYFFRWHVISLAAWYARRGEPADFRLDECLDDLESVYCPLGITSKELQPALQHAIYTFVKAHLLYSMKCRLYDEPGLVPLRDSDDRFSISRSGEYYLRTMITLLEYHYFMIGAIDWADEDIVWLEHHDVKQAHPDLGETRRVRTTIRTMLRLLEREAECIEALKGVAAGTAGSRKPLLLYRERMSPLVSRPGSGDMFFSGRALLALRQYLKGVRPRAYRSIEPEMDAAVQYLRALQEKHRDVF